MTIHSGPQHRALTGAAAAHELGYIQSADPGMVGANKAWIDRTYNAPLPLSVRNVANNGWDGVGIVFDVRTFLAKGDGVTDDTAAIVAAYAAAAGNVLYFPPGTYLCDPITVPATTKTLGADRGNTALKQRTGSAPGNFITAGGADVIFDEIAIDGNRDNMTLGDSPALIYYGTYDRLTVRNCALRAAPGMAIFGTTGKNADIHHNIFDNLYRPAFENLSTANFNAFHQLHHNFVTRPGSHVFLLYGASGSQITFNTSIGDIITGSMVHVGAGATATLTRDSGTAFTNVRAGMYAILNGGTELIITAVNPGAGTMTISNPNDDTSAIGSAGSPVAAAFGTGDQISVDASDCLIQSNTVYNGIGAGIGVHNYVVLEPTLRNRVLDNKLIDIGGAGILIAAVAEVVVGGVHSARFPLYDTDVLGNHMYDCGLAGAAVSPNASTGILISGAADGFMLGTTIDGANRVRTFGTTTYWLRVVGQDPKEVLVGKNIALGTTFTSTGAIVADTNITSLGGAANPVAGGISGASIVELVDGGSPSGSSKNISGVAGGYEGAVKTIYNATSGPRVLKYEDTSNLVATERLNGNGAADKTLARFASIRLIHDGTRWIM